MVKGLGLTKCTTFNSATNDEKVIYMSWLAGFMSSHNILKKNCMQKILHIIDHNYGLNLFVIIIQIKLLKMLQSLLLKNFLNKSEINFFYYTACL